MNRRYFVIGLITAIALSSCGLGKPAIVGKWKCINPDGSSVNTFEYLADGTRLQSFEYINKPSYMSDLEWNIKKDDKKSFVATWKATQDRSCKMAYLYIQKTVILSRPLNIQKY